MNKNKIYPRWFVILPLIIYVVFFLFPSILGVFYSFTDWGRMTPKNGLHFIGLQNYIDLFTSNKNYMAGFWNTVRFTLISNVVKIIPAFFLAILLNSRLKGKKFYRTVFYLPSILPFVIIGIIFSSIFSYNTGLLNSTFTALGLGVLKQKWLSDPNMVWNSIFSVDAWRGIGYVMTIFLAGLNTIDDSLYEAAEIDGAGFWKKLSYVTLPMMRGPIMINLVFGITYGLKVFDIIYVLTNGGPGHKTEVMTTYVLQLYGSGQYGMSTAMNTILLAVTAVIGVIIVKVMSGKEAEA
ncbi:MAG: carbohydrate ABC transporter permease [Bilifractor sp.]